MNRMDGGNGRSGYSRRRLLQRGGIGALGLSLPELLRLRAASAAAGKSNGFGRARSVIMLFMTGGPPHQDTFDLKPDAPAEVRGEFKPIETNVSGIRISEHYPRLAQVADRYAIVRSLSHPGIDHSTSAYEVLTGHRHPNPGERRDPGPDDFPHVGAVVSRFRRPENPVPPFVALPEKAYITGGAPDFPGQTGGFMGPRYDPFRIDGDFSSPGFRVPDIALPGDVDPRRLLRRRALLEAAGAKHLAESLPGQGQDVFYERALDMLTSPATRRAFDVTAEPPKVREAYGMHRHGQAVLVARRLVEAGVPFICVYWHRERPDIDTTWDTHANNFKELKDRLMPQTDQPHAQLFRDLHDRGLLDETLVVWVGEFGRTPKINPAGGRDHWGHCGCALLAGAGVQGGQVLGSSDETAAYPASDPVSPADLTATIYHALGIDRHLEITDRLSRPFPLSSGEPLLRLY
ncbi:MAG: DUF1501 domain-containing protein [Armatimonadota bacterium]